MSRLSLTTGSELDLVAVVALVAAADLALLVSAVPRAVAWAVGVPLLVFLPGYALVSAAMPAGPNAHDDGYHTAPGWSVRIALSLVGSVLVVALTGVALSATVGIRLAPALVVISAVTVAAVVLASVRRSLLPVDARANPLADPGPLLPVSGSASQFEMLAVTVGILALVGTIAYAGAVPTTGQPYSESYLLTENSTGALVTADANTTFVAGEGRPMYVAIENHEGGPRTYDVVATAQRVGADGTVEASERVDRFSIQVGSDQRVRAARHFAPTITGDRVRLRVLVYEDGVPDEPTASNADLSMRLWIDVRES